MGKQCKTCGLEKEASEYNKKANAPDGLDYHCKPCRKEYNRKRYENGAADAQRRSSFLYKYGISLEAAAAMYETQGGCCAICDAHGEFSVGRGSKEDKWKQLVLDHCHQTEEVRGLVCQYCNVGLGKFKDNPDTLRAAIAYLEKHSG